MRVSMGYTLREEKPIQVCGGTSHNKVGKYKSLDAMIKSSFPSHPSLFPNSPNLGQTRKEKGKPKHCDVAVADHSWLTIPVPEPMIKCRSRYRDSANYETGSCSGWVWDGRD